MSTEIAVKKASVLLAIASRYGMEGSKFLETLKGTVMKPDKDGRVPSDEEIAAYLLVAKEYDLNPFTREIYAFPDKRAGIIPVVSIDGWISLINRHPEYDGMTLEDAPNDIFSEGAKPCPEWMEVTIYRKDRAHPIIVREYLDEVYQKPRGGFPGPWQTHTKRMLRHKTIIQGARVAFGFAGIYDEDEAERITQVQEIEADVTIQAPRRLSERPAVVVEKVISPTPPEPEPAHKISEEQLKRLFTIANKSGKTKDEIKVYLKDTYNIDTSKDIKISDYDTLIKWLQTSESADSGKITVHEVMKMIEGSRILEAHAQIEPFIDEFTGEEKVKVRMAYDKKYQELQDA